MSDIYFDIIVPTQVQLYVIERSGPAATSTPGQLLDAEEIATGIEQQATLTGSESTQLYVGSESLQLLVGADNDSLNTALVGN